MLNTIVGSVFAAVERVGGGGVWGLLRWVSKAEGGFEGLVKVFDGVFEVVGEGEGVRLRRYRGWKQWEL